MFPDQLIPDVVWLDAADHPAVLHDKSVFGALYAEYPYDLLEPLPDLTLPWGDHHLELLHADEVTADVDFPDRLVEPAPGVDPALGILTTQPLLGLGDDIAQEG